MTDSVLTNYSTQHGGVARLERAVQVVRHAWHRMGHGSLAVAAIVAAVLVVANQVVDTWADGGLLAVWILMWLAAFGAMAVFARPAKRLATAVAGTLAQRRAQSAEDQRLREIAQADARVMADISRGMDARASDAR